jgi:DNA mismatch repair ATPase MutL
MLLQHLTTKRNTTGGVNIIQSVADVLERLVTNSVEASAREVSCELFFSSSSSFSSFLPSMRVRDDGEGMTERDLHLVGEFGCTSKRGKSGASLAAIAQLSERVQIVTRKKMGGGSETASPSTRTFSATLVSSAEGSKRKVKGMLPSAYRNSGAIITVDRVFSRGSALIQKKMKADGFETYAQACEKEARERVLALSLINPKVTLILTVKKKINDEEWEEKEVFRSRGNVLANLADLYGEEDVTVRALRPVCYEKKGSHGAPPSMRASGYITWAENYIHRRKIQYLYINRAHVRERTKYHTVIERSFEEIHKKKSSSVAYVLHISTTTADEKNEELISAFLRETVKKISSESTEEKINAAESPRVPSSSSKKQSSSKKKRHLDNDDEEEEEEEEEEEKEVVKKKQKQRCECCTIQKLPFQLNNAIVSPKKKQSPKKMWVNPAFALVNNREVLKLPPSSKTVTSNELRESRVVGQFAKKFIVLITKDTKELLLVDQHAADERCIVEDLEKSYLEERPAGRAVNLVAKLDRDEYIASCDFRDAIVRSGFEWEEIGLLQIKLTRVPALFEASALKEFKVLLHELGGGAATATTTGGGVALPPSFRRAFAKKSCRSAIMFGDALTQKECDIVVKSLSSCKAPFSCAHGRPTCLPLGSISF